MALPFLPNSRRMSWQPELAASSSVLHLLWVTATLLQGTHNLSKLSQSGITDSILCTFQPSGANECPWGGEGMRRLKATMTVRDPWRHLYNPGGSQFWREKGQEAPRVCTGPVLCWKEWFYTAGLQVESRDCKTFRRSWELLVRKAGRRSGLENPFQSIVSESFQVSL